MQKKVSGIKANDKSPDVPNVGSKTISANKVPEGSTFIRSEERIRRAEAIASIGTWEMSGRNGDVYWSDEFYKLHGLAPQSIKPSKELRLSMVHPDDRGKLCHAIEEALQKGKPYCLEKRIVQPDGKIKWVLSQGEVEVNTPGPPSIFGVLIDITARKLTELEKDNLEVSLKKSQEVASLGNWEMIDGCDGYWSDELYRIYGLKPGSIPPSAMLRLSLVHPDDRAKFLEAIAQSEINGEPYSIEMRVVRSTGEVRWVLSQGEVSLELESGKQRIFGTVLDITEKKRLMENLSLQKSLEEFQQAISKSSIVSMADKKGNITYVNDNFIMISGYNRSELIGQNHRIVNSAYHSKNFWVNMWKTIASGKTWRADVKNKAKDGSYYWVDTFVMPFLGEHGEIREFLSIRNDITQRKLQEENITALNQSLADFQDAIQYSSIVSRADREGTITYVNDNFVAISGYSNEELIGQNHRIVNSGYHPRAFWIEMWRAIANGKIWRAEVKNKAKDGSFYWVDTFVMPFLDDKGRVKEFLSIRNDITQRKLQEENIISLNQSLADFQNAIQSSSIVSRANKAGIITYVNENFVKISGYSNEELIGQNHRIVNSTYHPKSFWIEMWKTIASGRIWRAEVKNKAKDGSFYWVDTFVMPFLDERGMAKEFLSIRNDITSRKQSEEALSTSQQKAELASKAKSEFLANMSHEIRTPLNGVIGFTDLLMKTKLDTIQNQYMATISQSAYSLLDIVNQLLDFSKIEAGKMELVKEPIDLFILCEQVIEILSYQAQQKQIKLIHTYSPSVPRFIHTDPIRLKQVLVNLLGNAIKFTNTGEIELKIETSELEHDLKKGVHEKFGFRFSVRDTGVGIHPDNKEKIFGAFLQEDSSVSKKYGGTGLGLTISNKLLHLMHSRLNLESELGVGSIFYFNVAFEIPADNKLLNTTARVHGNVQGGNSNEELQLINKIQQQGLRNIKILIAEDNVVNMALAKAIVSNAVPEGILLEAANGKLAVEMFINEKPDIIFMDVQMPEMNGFEATGEIRRIEKAYHTAPQRHVPIIALTAGAIQGEREKCLNAGMDDFITKPIINDAIEKVLQQWIPNGLDPVPSDKLNGL